MWNRDNGASCGGRTPWNRNQVQDEGGGGGRAKVVDSSWGFGCGPRQGVQPSPFLRDEQHTVHQPRPIAARRTSSESSIPGLGGSCGNSEQDNASNRNFFDRYVSAADGYGKSIGSSKQSTSVTPFGRSGGSPASRGSGSPTPRGGGLSRFGRDSGSPAGRSGSPSSSSGSQRDSRKSF